MAKAEVILVRPVSGLGSESDRVEVTAGYARNYLIPGGYAVPLTASNRRRLEVLKARRIERESREVEAANELATSLSKLILTLKVRTGENGRLFGSVTPAKIAIELKQQFDVDIDKRKIHLEDPIKELGEFGVDLKLHGEIIAALKVRVESINQPAENVAAKQIPRAEKAAEKK